MKKIVIFLCMLIAVSGVRADEGMWMLPLIKKLNAQKLNGMGCQLTAEEIYSDKSESLKDAVIVFGGGCTGVTVSNQGLIFTNHHCGFDAIQQRSSVEHNYLKNGFTAEKLTDEIPCPGLTVKYLVRVEDMTERVLTELPDTLSGKARSEKLSNIARTIQTEATKGNHYIAQLKSFFSGNEFYLFVFEEFKDIRLAFTPPSSIGKFGGDTDNWMWPRHTGDFSVFRVYCAKDGKPATYAESNIPYTPKRFAAISNQGYTPGDFSMIMGNPGTTNRYLSSWGINYRMKATNMARIEVRGVKQDVWRSFMRADEAINIAYASKYARSSNYWKNSIGMNKAIEKLSIIDKKNEQEKAFETWVNSNSERKEKYSTVLNTLEESYQKAFPYGRAVTYIREALIEGIEMPRIAATIEMLVKKNTPKDILLKAIDDMYKDYYPQVDEATMSAMLDIYKKSVDNDALPQTYNLIQKRFKNDCKLFAETMYKKSVFANADKAKKAVEKGKIDFDKDPAIQFANDIKKTHETIQSEIFMNAMQQIKDAERVYEKGIMEWSAEKGVAIAPDANFTMRLTYGKVGGYEPADAVKYDYFTTTKGILQKEIPGDAEFDVPSKLKEAITTNNYGAYLDKKTGKMHVAFLSNNDITGGNSGSPIFNAKGELIGLAFDGNWEAMSGDIVFEPDLQRTINVDIRYVLFVMDKVGNAKRLINELTIK